MQSLYTHLSGDLASQQQSLRGFAVSKVVRECKTALDAVPRIKASYRMTGREPPTTPLPYVEAFVKPFADALMKSVPESALTSGMVLIPFNMYSHLIRVQ